MVPTRRRVLGRLALASTAATVAMAGCLAASDDGPRLGAVTVSNLDDAPHEFTLRVRDGDDLVHTSSYSIEAREPGRIPGATAPCEWNGSPGEYEVAVRVDDSEWTTKSLADDVGPFENPDCLTARGRYEGDGRVTIEAAADCERFDGAWLVGSPCARTAPTTDD